MEKNQFEEIKRDFILPFQKLGVKEYENGTIEYGHVPHFAPQAYLINVYSPINNVELQTLQDELKRNIPEQYNSFLTEISNGLCLFLYFNLYGHISSLDRSPDAPPQAFPLDIPNIYERPKNSKDSYFYIGGYRYDGSKLYIDELTGKVHYCKRRDATSLFSWDSFDEMLLSETKRLFKLFDDKGIMLVSSNETLPVK